MPDISIRQSSETQDSHKFILLKTEKLSVAVHIVTGHLSAREAVREELRRLSLQLVSDVRALINGEQGDFLSDTIHLCTATDGMISMLYVAKTAKLIGQGNSSLLEREYAELGNFFTKNHLEHSTLGTLPATPANTSSIRHHTDDKRHMSKYVRKNQKNVNTQPNGIARKESILNSIQGREAYSLSDIASKIRGVSEKTIQRDLLALVAEKVLKKTGERRWSRYLRA